MKRVLESLWRRQEQDWESAAMRIYLSASYIRTSLTVPFSYCGWSREALGYLPYLGIEYRAILASCSKQETVNLGVWDVVDDLTPKQASMPKL